jgi:hypothetical protein
MTSEEKRLANPKATSIVARGVIDAIITIAAKPSREVEVFRNNS